jgi:hypothetical protein
MLRKTIRRVAFRMKWLTMSERSRYAYLWARTQENW